MISSAYQRSLKSAAFYCAFRMDLHLPKHCGRCSDFPQLYARSDNGIKSKEIQCFSGCLIPEKEIMSAWPVFIFIYQIRQFSCTQSAHGFSHDVSVFPF